LAKKKIVKLTRFGKFDEIWAKLRLSLGKSD